MTFSIASRSDDGSCWGVAVASKFLGVGAAVPALEAGVGAIATQAWVNLGYRPQGLALLRLGLTAPDVVAALGAGDPRRDVRQLGVVDARGGSATWTGPKCQDWAGGRSGPGYAVQGNILVGPQVVEAMEAAWLAPPPSGPGPGLALARRLLSALAAGDGAGGDRRGRQSAAVAVVGLGPGLDDGPGRGQGADVVVDLRTDDHPDPVVELGRLLDLADLYLGEPDPASLLRLTAELAEEVDRRVRALGQPDLETWAGVENYELRMVPGHIDRFVLARLREQATA